MFCQYGPRCQFLHNLTQNSDSTSSNKVSYHHKMKNMEKLFMSTKENDQSLEEFFHKESSSPNCRRLAVFCSLVAVPLNEYSNDFS